jgi:hypothetical protein
MAFAPYRGPDWHDLAHDRLGREPSAGNDGCDVIDLDTTGHPITPYTGAARGGCTADAAAVLVVWSRILE